MAHWLSAASDEPRAVRALWAQGRTATLSNGRLWDTIEMSLVLSSPTATYLAYRGRHIGPYLLCGTQATAWWLVEPGRGYELADSEHVKVLPPGSPITAPAPGTYKGERLWILPEAPCPWLRLTSPDALRTAVHEAVQTRPGTRRPPRPRAGTPRGPDRNGW
ncbi:hypothetical protein [Streptomyces varsoviensis]|uniref:AraC family transcriptional regulator n=1 Tax=Streptomyces varsoviensis TaxID=67373 RepID=A0ABR5J131_9ACTN|nr:hypothetical protein [Streptomyces varsoviensis]KOG87074.1 hypothetical protein ADK38_27455 [Streptomyces varsoviensis]